jgi:beta-lactamase class A
MREQTTGCLMNISSRTKQLVIGGAAVLAVAAVAFTGGYFVARGTAAEAAEPDTRESVSTSRLTSPFIECVGESRYNQGLLLAREEVLRYIGESRAKDATLQVSVYGRDLHDGAWMGIDERAPYVPASLLKVHVMAYVLAQADKDPTLLERRMTYPGRQGMKGEDTMAGAADSLLMRPGQSYSVRDLLFRMIAYSDNHAKELLMSTGITEADLDRFTHDFNASPTYEGGLPIVNAKSYSAVFRILYNSNLLSRERSEYALELLTKTRFHVGLRKYLPGGIPVASKYGFQSYAGPYAAKNQLHECGIIYTPGAPYILCILTKSDKQSPDELAEIIANISRIVWEQKRS